MKRVVATMILFAAGCNCHAPTSAPPASDAQSSEETECCEVCERTTLFQDKNKVPAVELKSIKLDALMKEIASHKGKTVIIDVWASFCVPCKAEFPNLVRLHKEKAKNGLVCMSVCVDDVDDAKARDAALKFLRTQNATFANYLLDEETRVWQDRWDLKGIPAVFLFQDGKQVARFDRDDPDNQFTYADIEKKLVTLLKVP